jgi:hypothetical protein
VSFTYDAAPIVRKKEEIKEKDITSDDRARGDIIRTMDGRFYRVVETDQLVKLNTGIAEAWDIGAAVDLIREHPLAACRTGV